MTAFIREHYYYLVMVFTIGYSLAFVFFLSGRFHYSRTAKKFAYFLIVVSGWAVKDSLAEILQPYFDQATYMRVVGVLSALFLCIPVFAFDMLAAVYNAFVPGEKQFTKTAQVRYALGGTLLGTYVVTLIDPRFIYWDFTMAHGTYLYEPGPGMIIFGLSLILTSGVLAAGIVKVSWKDRRSEAFFIGLGAIITLAVSITTNIVPTWTGLGNLPRLGGLSMFLLCGMTFYAIKRYGRIFPVSRMLEEQAKSQMIANSLTAIVDVYEQKTIHQKICDYCREISESEMVCIAFFSEDQSTYTVQTLSCRTAAVQRAVSDRLPLEIGKQYPALPHGFARRGAETEAPLEFASLREFLGDTSSMLDLGHAELAGIRQVISYPIVYEHTIKGALVLFRRHPSENTELFRIFAIQCSLVLKFSSQIKQLEEMRRLEGQLFQAQKMEAVGKLAGGIAHDFNNMLSGISGYANLIKRKFGADKPELKNFATAILSASERAADLTRKLLAFARKGKYQTVHIDMHQTIHEVIQLLERTIDPRIKITQRLHASPSIILGDPTQVQNMVLNLAINARDAMPEGGELILETEAVTLEEGMSADGRYEIKAGAYLQLSVADTGVGMDTETRERVFEPFFTTKSVGKGTGLGLASVYGTVKSHGGFITVDSQKGKGSTFTVHIPLSKANVTPAQTAQTEEIVRGHGHIMVVDDEQMVCNLSREVLSYLGYTVHTCNDGTQAVEYYRRNPDKVDVVILDVIMPGMDGYETFQKLREVRDDVKVIITTGYSLKEDTNQILSRGVCGFIQKPFESGKLSRLVHDVITGKAPGGGR